MASSTTTRMRKWFPTTSSPLVISAPMAGVVNPRLATEVVKGGGLGFIQGGRDFAPESPEIKKLDDQLTLAKTLLAGVTPSSSGSGTDILPLGVGFVTYARSATDFPRTILPILQKHRPAAVWLFAPDPEAATDTLREVIASLQAAGQGSSPKVVVQVGSVAAAREAARHGADVVVAQGVDAGGHQFASTSGVVSLVPEVADMLRDEFAGKEVALWAAGGIADGRGVAAALALGAEGGVLGSRYIVSEESDAPEFKKDNIISTSDGAATTVKSFIHDHIQSNFSWPSTYDARAIIHPSYLDSLAGVPFEENLRRYKEAEEKGDLSRMVTWSGSGVGLIRQKLPAAEITRRVREEALDVIMGIRSKI